MKKILKVAVLSSTLLSPLFAQSSPAPKQEISSEQSFQAKDYSHLLGMPGFSDTMLNNHFKLYQGYVKNTNLLLSLLKQLSADGKNRTPEYAELKRRLGWEFDGMRLHEYYFGNMGGHDNIDHNSVLYNQIVKDFGSYEAWKEDFIATGAMRGIGWAILYFDPVSNKLINTWINEHDVGHLAGGTPLLVMDVFEHAYMTDYGIDRAKYIDAYFKNINWEPVVKRFPENQRNANGSPIRSQKTQ